MLEWGNEGMLIEVKIEGDYQRNKIFINAH